VPGPVQATKKQQPQREKSEIHPSIHSAAKFQALVAAVDWIVSAGSFLLAFRLRFVGHIPTLAEIGEVLNLFQLGRAINSDDFRPYFLLFLLAPVIKLFWLNRKGLYNLKGEFSRLDDLINIVRATTMATLVLIVVAFMYRGLFEFREYSYSRGIFLLDWLLALAGISVCHLLVREAQFVLRRRSHNLIRSVIVGEGALAELCLSEITTKPQLGYKVVGIVSSDKPQRAPTSPSQNILGRLDDLPRVVSEHRIEQVFITDPDVNPDLLFETVLKCWRTSRAAFSVVPHMLNCLPTKTKIDQIGSLPMIELFQEPLRGPSRFIKRGCDIIGSAFGLVITSPVLGLLSLVIKLDSGGPSVFRQERVGMDGRVFLAYKFRTMHSDADEHPHREAMTKLIKGHLDEPPTVETESFDPDAPLLFGKVPDDPRITRVGRWLRRWSLDELPQLINVLKGEMSLVGPRPPIPYEVEHYSAWHRKRLEIKPGLTGLWQVSGRNRLPFDRMIELDIYYIENWSLWLDFKIILKTPLAIIRGETG
jgi:exopolysaccharide biosynthesis polyprenyl glycosylphosphotransferase